MRGRNVGAPASPAGSRADASSQSSLSRPEASIPSAAFTPGPWGICHNGDCSCKSVWCDDHPIAEVVHGEWGDEYPAIRFIEDHPGMIGTAVGAYMERIVYGEVYEATAKANGRLIASAPSLFAALQYARNLIGPDEVIDGALTLAIDGDLEREAKMSALYEEMINRTAEPFASGTEARQRQDPEEGLDPKGDGPTAESGDAQHE